jgi:hypothetical protein
MIRLGSLRAISHGRFRCDGCRRSLRLREGARRMLAQGMTGHFVFPRAREGFGAQFPQNRPP